MTSPLSEILLLAAMDPQSLSPRGKLSPIVGTRRGGFGLTAQTPTQDDPGANGTRLQVHVGKLVARLLPESQIKGIER